MNSGASTTESSNDSVLAQLADVDRTIGNDGNRGPIEPEIVPPNDPERSSEPANDQPSPFLLQTCAGIVAKTVQVSKAMGWKGTGVEGIYSEEEWTVSVATLSATVIHKRWPTLANAATPEMQLALLIIPWALWAVPVAFQLMFKKKPANDGSNDGNDGKTAASDRDTRRDGDGKNNDDANVAEPVSPGVPH